MDVITNECRHWISTLRKVDRLFFLKNLPKLGFSVVVFLRFRDSISAPSAISNSGKKSIEVKHRLQACLSS